MAIIRCPECNHEVSTLAQTCPFCGVNIAGNLVTCPDCGKTLLRQTKTCPNCSCDITNTPIIPSPIINNTNTGKPLNGKMPKPHKRYHVWPWIVFIAILFLGAGGYFLYEHLKYTEALNKEYLALENNYNIDDYTTFLSNYPSSKYSADIEKRLDTLRIIQKQWQEVTEADSITAYKDFLAMVPHSAYTELCNIKIDSLDWLDANSENTQEAYQKYIALHVDGKYTELAKKSIDELDKLVVTYSERDSIRNLITTYFAFISQHNTAALSEIITTRLMEQNSFLYNNIPQNVVYRVISNIYISKIPTKIADTYNYVAKFQVEKHNANFREVFQGRSLIYSNMHISSMTLTPIETE